MLNSGPAGSRPVPAPTDVLPTAPVAAAVSDDASSESDCDDSHIHVGDSDSDNEQSFSGRNFKYFKRKLNPLNDTVLSNQFTQDELDEAQGVPDRWLNHEANILAYIDDLNVVEKVRHSDALVSFTTQKSVSYAHAPQSQVFFQGVSKRARELNMRVNEAKPQVLCISAARDSDVQSYINTECSRISSANELKILGFWFGSKPGVSLHIEKTAAKFRRRLWTLRHLKRSGLGVNDLVFM